MCPCTCTVCAPCFPHWSSLQNDVCAADGLPLVLEWGSISVTPFTWLVSLDLILRVFPPYLWCWSCFAHSFCAFPIGHLLLSGRTQRLHLSQSDVLFCCSCFLLDPFFLQSEEAGFQVQSRRILSQKYCLDTASKYVLKPISGDEFHKFAQIYIFS